MMLRTYLPDLNCSEFNEILLYQKDLICGRFSAKLCNLNSICKRLQPDSTTLSHNCTLFNTVLDHQPWPEYYLDCEAIILDNLVFEIAVVKPQIEQVHELSANEHQIVK